MSCAATFGRWRSEADEDYYRPLIAAGHTRIIINSVAGQNLVGMTFNGDTTGAVDYLSGAVEQLANAGADVVFDEVQRRARSPLVSIVEAVAEHVDAMRITRVGLPGTRFTVEGRFYPEVFRSFCAPTCTTTFLGGVSPRIRTALRAE